MIENGMFKLRDFSPCAKAVELSVKNEGMMEWLNAGRKMGSAGTDHFPE